MNLNILLEEIYGNTAIVYHRGDKNTLKYLLNGTYTNKLHMDFDKYNQGLYTTFDLDSQINSNEFQKNNMKETYGNFIIKLAVKGISNFWFCDYIFYKQYNPTATPENWKEQQFKKFNIEEKLRPLFGGSKTEFNHWEVSRLFEKADVLGTRVKGIIYYGKYDGACALIYDWKTAVPVSISNDDGKTWKKIDKNKTLNSRSNFGKNDYIDTNKNLHPDFFQKNEKGDVKCDNNKLTSLFNKQPIKIVDRDFLCHNNKLTSLEGAPETVGRDFRCDNNKLVSLQHSPKTVGRDFVCSSNELTSLEGAPKYVGGSFVCDFNDKLTSLQGAPQKIGKGLSCVDTSISKEEAIRYLKDNDCPKVVSDFGTIYKKRLIK